MPITAQIAFAFAFYIIAGSSFHYGIGHIGDGHKRPAFIAVAVLIGLLPFMWID